MPVSLHACALAGGAQCACSRSLDDDVFAVLIRVLVRTPRRRGPGSRPVPLEPSERPEWAQNMALRWGELREADDFADTAHRRLLLLKRAIASVSLEMNTSAQHAAAATASDRLGCAIRCLRAVEEGRWLAAQRAVDEFPELIDQHRLQAAFAGNGEAQRALRDRAVQLDKEDIHQELRDLESASPGLPPEVAAARRETVADKIRRLKPGSGSHLTAIKGPDGNVSTDPEAIAQELARHWSGVFAERGVDDARLTAWLQESGARGDTSLPSHPGQWSVRRQDVHTALQQARATSPGPDGISAILWRRLGALAEDVLFDAACSLSSSSAPADLQAAYADELDDHAGAREHSFNLGLLCCVPKKAVELHPTFGEVYTAEGTRPLSLVDTSNRIMAGAYKQRWEGPLGQWVSSVQRGFLPWRSMLANVVELEHDAMLTATQKQRGMILLVDFKAAFPSVSHRFLRRCLEGFGMPGEALRVLDALYDQGRCKVAVGGARWPGFSLRSGIRQGCPLSPQVFATAMDLLLRVLTSRLGPAATIRAFADDVGIILTDIETQLPILELALREFGQLSGMEVDLPKTVGIPLWGGTMEEAAATVAQACPSWSQLPLRRAAVYLGCAVGPGKGDVMWSTALNKFRERVGGWQWSDMGLHFAAAAYNSYALPVLSFLVQVAAPTDDVLAAESWALRRAAPGPGNWAMPEDHWGLKENYGMPRSFGSLQDLTKAAQLRVFHCENSAHGGLQLEVRAAQLRTAAALSRFPERFLLWATWFSTAIPAALCRNADELRAQSITTAKVEAAAAEGGRTFQAAARELIAAKARRDPHFRIRHKFERWQLPGAPRTAATRFEHNLQRLRGLVPPRVVAAVFSTGWNRWCTARRFQRRAATSNFCKLGCGGVAEDSIEHYTRCRAVRRFHATSMRIDADWLLPHWLVVHHTQRSDVDLVLGALRAYAVYRATNAARALGGMTAEGAARALQQALRDAVAGHRGAERVLRGCADLLVGACRSIRGCGGPRLSEALVSRQGSFAGLPGASPLGASSSTPAAPPCAGGDAASPAASPLQGAAAHLAAEAPRPVRCAAPVLQRQAVGLVMWWVGWVQECFMQWAHRIRARCLRVKPLALRARHRPGGPAAACGTRMSGNWYVGQKVEYWSPSYNEWIECQISAVKPEGLKLQHLDGSNLKESADPSRVRPKEDKPKASAASSPPPLPSSGAAAAGGGAARRASQGGRPPPGAAGASQRSASPAAALGSPPAQRRPSSRGALSVGGAAVVAGGAGGAGLRQLSPGPAAKAAGPAAAGGGSAPSSARGRPPGAGQPGRPLQQAPGQPGEAQALYAGDRVRLKGGRLGQVMYVGPANFAGGSVVVGIKLDDRKPGSDCDGKVQGERYFRCSAGLGTYEPRGEVELVPPELADDDVRQLAFVQAPDAESFDLETELQQLAGLKEVKDSIKHIRNFVEVQRRRSNVVGGGSFGKALHFALAEGSSGCGITTACRLLGGMLLKLGVLSKGHVVEVTKRDLLTGASSSEVEPRLKKMVAAASGGVLLLREVDALGDVGDRHAQEALQAICRLFEDPSGQAAWPQPVCVALAGKRSELQKCFSDQPPLAEAVYARLDFVDLTPDEVALVLRKLVRESKFQLSEELSSDDRLSALVRRRALVHGGAAAPKNTRLARAMLEEAMARHTDRVYAAGIMTYEGLTTLCEDDFEDRSSGENEAAQAALKKLGGIVGLKPVKEFVHSLHAQLQLQQQKRELGIAMNGASSTLHMVFTGNPGTGKTTIARVVADLLRALGLLRTGHLVEADRSALVAGYSGQTAIKTKAVVESALGGVLFVDEAYALIGDEGKDSFGREALDTLIKLVEDFRSDLVVILAGYSAEMDKLLETNPGLRSRFPTLLEFDDYSGEELLEIAEQMLRQDVLVLSESAAQRLRSVLQVVAAKSGGRDARAAGNGRAVRNILERAKRSQAVRLQRQGGRRTQEELCMLLPEDFEGAG
ncbi:unnamed protein product [Prorocentrum cordatum]|nr:unnamed protein product [Polarella glacialis]